MEPTLRLGEAKDVAAIRTLLESAYRGDSARRGWTHEADLLNGERTSEAEVSAILAAPDQDFIVAEQDDAVIGCVAISKKPPDHCYLGMLAVSPAHQAGGIGRQLMAAAERQAASRFGASVMEMTVIHRRPELIAYYQRRGYRPTGEIRPFPYAAPETADLQMVVLERSLA